MYSKYIGNIGEEEGLYPHAGMLLLNPVSQYICMSLPKTGDNYRTHIEMLQTRNLDIWSMFLSGQVPHRSNSSHLLRNLEDSCAQC